MYIYHSKTLRWVLLKEITGGVFEEILAPLFKVVF